MAKSTFFLPFAGFRTGGSGSGMGLRRLERVSCVWLLLQEIQMVTSSSNSSKDCQGLQSSKDRNIGCMGGGNHFYGLFHKRVSGALDGVERCSVLRIP